MSKVAILQSNYIPWRGYFDLIRQVDHFIFYDEVQYTKNDWRNRNAIVPPTGRKWLTLPIDTAGKFGQRISDAQIKETAWAKKHFDTLRQVYRRAPFASEWMPRIRTLYASLDQETRLSRVNQRFIREISAWLGLNTTFHDSAAYFPAETGRVERLLGLVKAVGGVEYLSGPAANDYLDADSFCAAGLRLTWFAYPSYPAYTQLDGGYNQSVSILDTLLNAGVDQVFCKA